MGYIVGVSVNVLLNCPGGLEDSPSSPERVLGFVLALRWNCAHFSTVPTRCPTETVATGNALLYNACECITLR